MAYETGTASDYIDLLDKFQTFVTTHADLVAASQEWSHLETHDGVRYFQAPGLTGTAEIYTAIEPIAPGGDAFNWEISGLVGHLATTDISLQPGVSPAVYIHLMDAPMTYWFVANGQRAVVIAKVSTVFQAAYLGKILPYGTPAQYPYPHFVGGTSSHSDYRWSEAHSNHAAFTNPGEDGARLHWLDGAWLNIENRNNVGNDSGDGHYVWPTRWRDAVESWDDVRDNPDGTYTLVPFILYNADPGENVIGEFDGVFWVTGYSQAAEDIITIGGEDYLVVQDTYRTNPENYFAVKLV